MKCAIIDEGNHRKIDITLDVIPKIGESININAILMTGEVIKIVHNINTNYSQNDVRRHIIWIYIN